MMKKILVVFLIIFMIIFIQIAYKKIIIGNNVVKSDKNNFLNISSYETITEIEIHSNKNTNKYILKQEYQAPNKFKQEIIEPTNIKGLTTIFDGTNLIIENKSLDLKKIYENYSFMKGNSLSLQSFIEEYKENGSIEEKENEEEKIIKIKSNGNKYQAYKKLYINKKSKIPSKMEILDINQNVVVYILYKEIKIK